MAFTDHKSFPYILVNCEIFPLKIFVVYGMLLITKLKTICCLFVYGCFMPGEHL